MFLLGVHSWLHLAVWVPPLLLRAKLRDHSSQSALFCLTNINTIILKEKLPFKSFLLKKKERIHGVRWGGEELITQPKIKTILPFKKKKKKKKA